MRNNSNNHAGEALPLAHQLALIALDAGLRCAVYAVKGDIITGPTDDLPDLIDAMHARDSAGEPFELVCFDQSGSRLAWWVFTNPENWTARAPNALAVRMTTEAKETEK